MDRYEKLVMNTLKAHGAVLVRHKKHMVYRFPDGRTWTHASTPSCPHSMQNNFSDLRRMLGIADDERGQPGERREKRRKTHRAIPFVSLSDAPVKLSGSIREALQRAVRMKKPEMQCFPFDVRPVYGTAVTVVLSRLLGGAR